MERIRKKRRSKWGKERARREELSLEEIKKIGEKSKEFSRRKERQEEWRVGGRKRGLGRE